MEFLAFVMANREVFGLSVAAILLLAIVCLVFYYQYREIKKDIGAMNTAIQGTIAGLKEEHEKEIKAIRDDLEKHYATKKDVSDHANNCDKASKKDVQEIKQQIDRIFDKMGDIDAKMTERVNDITEGVYKKIDDLTNKLFDFAREMAQKQ